MYDSVGLGPDACTPTPPSLHRPIHAPTLPTINHFTTQDQGSRRASMPCLLLVTGASNRFALVLVVVALCCAAAAVRAAADTTTAFLPLLRAAAGRSNQQFYQPRSASASSLLLLPVRECVCVCVFNAIRIETWKNRM